MFFFPRLLLVNFGLKICSFNNPLIRQLSLSVVYYFLKFLYYDTFLIERVRDTILHKRKMYIVVMGDLKYSAVFEYRYERFEAPFGLNPFLIFTISRLSGSHKENMEFYFIIKNSLLTVGIFFYLIFF